MTTRTKTTAVALTGAVALASGAYALGTQSGGGDATAKAGSSTKSSSSKSTRAVGVRVIRRGPFGRAAGLQSLADKLGTTPAKLQAAFEALRTEKRDEFAQKLADELGIEA